MRQVIARTVARRLWRKQLWSGNLEPPLWTIFTDREHIVRWAWHTHPLTATRVTELLHRRPDLTVVRLESRTDATRWLTGLLQQSAPSPKDLRSSPPASNAI